MFLGEPENYVKILINCLLTGLGILEKSMEIMPKNPQELSLSNLQDKTIVVLKKNENKTFGHLTI